MRRKIRKSTHQRERLHEGSQVGPSTSGQPPQDDTTQAPLSLVIDDNIHATNDIRGGHDSEIPLSFLDEDAPSHTTLLRVRRSREKNKVAALQRRTKVIPIQCNEDGQPVCENASMLSTFIGVIARDGSVLPIDVKDWRRMPRDVPNNVWTRVLSRFSFPDQHPRTRRWVVEKVVQCWKEWKLYSLMAPPGGSTRRSNRLPSSDTQTVVSNTRASASGTQDAILPLHSTALETQDAPQDIQQQSEEARKKGVRGPNRGLRTKREVDRVGRKLLVKVIKGKNCLGGKIAVAFSNECGIAVRAHASLIRCKWWRNVPESEKQVIRGQVFTKFEVEDYDTDPAVPKIIDCIFQRLYREYRHNLHKHYKHCRDKLQIDPRTLPYKGVEQLDWEWLIDNVWENDSWKEKSVKNIDARSRLSYNHTMGPRSFPAMMHEMRDPETRQDPSFPDFYKKTHYNEHKKKWVSDRCEELHGDLQRLQEESSQGVTPLTAEEMSTRVLGTRRNYVKGLGTGPKPSSSATNNLRGAGAASERHAMREKIDALEMQVASQSKRLEEVDDLKAELAHMKQVIAKFFSGTLPTPDA